MREMGVKSMVKRVIFMWSYAYDLTPEYNNTPIHLTPQNCYNSLEIQYVLRRLFL